jgi:hypothetical protein
MSIGLTGTVIPLGEFPILEDVHTKGSFRAVANATIRDAISDKCRKAGMLVWTQDDETMWQLDSDLVTWVLYSSLPETSGEQYSVLMEDPGDTLVFARLHEEMVLPAFAISSFTKTNPNDNQVLYRRGSSISSITALASYTSGPPDSASIANTFGGSTNPSDIDPGTWDYTGDYTDWSLSGTVARFGTDLGSDPTMTATLTATKFSLKQSAFTITWTSDVWWGVGIAGYNTESQIRSLSGTSLATSRIRTFTVSPSNQKVYYSYPKAYGTAIFTLNGFPADFKDPFQLTIVSGIQRTYYIYESTYLLTGTNLAFVVT